MKIGKLVVKLGSHRQTFEDRNDEDPDIALLLKAAVNTDVVITIEVSSSPETAAALGRLVFFSRPTEKRETFEKGRFSPEQIKALSMRVNELDISVRAAQVFDREDIRFVWQIVEADTDLLQFKNFGPKSFIHIREILDDLGLCLGMYLEIIRDQLPH